MRTSMKSYVYSAGLTAALALVVGLMPVRSSAQDQNVGSENVMVASNETSNRIDLEFGYFTCRRQTFRQLYGSYFDYGLSFQHRFNSRWSWSLRTEFIRLADHHDWTLRYWTISFSPMLIYRFGDHSTLQPVIGGGVGASYRNVTAMYDPPGEPGLSREFLARRQELSVSTTAMAGVDFHVSNAIVLGARGYFDYHPLGDPSVGEFGDTGGYHFTFRLGHKF
jgi:hypothetical protein